MTDDTGRAAPRGLREKRFLNVNGARQAMFLRGTDVGKPVMLYLHSGLPEYVLTERRPTPLEEHFTVAWWHQRGAGALVQLVIAAHPPSPHNSASWTPSR